MAEYPILKDTCCIILVGEKPQYFYQAKWTGRPKQPGDKAKYVYFFAADKMYVFSSIDEAQTMLIEYPAVNNMPMAIMPFTIQNVISLDNGTGIEEKNVNEQ